MWTAFEHSAFVIPLLAAIIGAASVAATFLVRREHHPRIELRCDVHFVGEHGNGWIVEYLALVENKGQVPHTMQALSFDVRGLRPGDDASAGPEAIRGQAFFAHRIVPKDASLQSESLMPMGPGAHVTIYPGTSMRYMYVDKVPADFAFLLMHAKLKRSQGQPLVSDKVVALPIGNPSVSS